MNASCQHFVDTRRCDAHVFVGMSNGPVTPCPRGRGHGTRLTTLTILLLSFAGCQQEMAEQPSFRPLAPSEFYADGQSARPLVAGTVARGDAQLDRAMATGQRGPDQGGAAMDSTSGGVSLVVARTALAEKPYVDAIPLPVSRALLDRGRERYGIYCSVCHGPLGDGDGIVVERGFTRPPTYHDQRLRSAPVGYFFDVITHGYGSMPDYAAQIPPRDRWAIVGFVRVLQFSQYAPVDELPEPVRKAALTELTSENAPR
jgi:mono/diheme cytochrome c family protein